MKNLDIFSLKFMLFIFFIPRKMRQCIFSLIRSALTMINLKIILEELLSPTDLLGAQSLYIQKTAKVVIIGKYKNLVLAIL